MRDCQCTGPGWCQRHGVTKTARWVTLCQTSDVYWERWEAGRGPGQLAQLGAKSSREARQRGGPGTELSKILGWFGIRPQGKCKCKDHAAKMDAMGPDGCEEHMETILRWLKREAKTRGMPFSETAAAVLVRMAIANARRRQGKAQPSADQ